MYPLLIAGLALSAGGAGLEMAGAAKDQSAMNQAVENEVAQQQQFAQQGNQVFQTSLQASSPQSAQQQMQQGQQKALASYQALEKQPLTGSGQPTPFQTNTGALGLNTGRNQLSNLAQANLQGYSEWDLQQAIKDLQAQGQLGVINRNASGVASILPYQIQDASHKGDTLSGAGSLLGSVGGLVSGYGALGGGLGSLFGTAASAVPTVVNEALPTPNASYYLSPTTNTFQPTWSLDSDVPQG